MSELKIGSLFSGTGALDMAITQVTGATTAFVADVCGDPATKHWPHRPTCKSPCTILAHRFPGVPNLGDVSTIDWTAWAGLIAILCAGFPCQDVSTAGKRAGLKAGTRTGLWSEVVRAIVALKPRMVVLENVPGIFTADADGDVEPCPWCVGDGPDGYALHALDAVLADLAEIGFDAEWVCVPASGVGAPHKRLRWFLTAYPQGQPWSLIDRDGGAADVSQSDGRHEGWPESALVGGGSDASVSRGADVVLLPSPRTSDTNGPGAHGDGGLDLRTAVTLLPTPAAARSGRNRSASPGAAIRPSLDQTDATERGESRGIDFGQYAAAIARWENVLGRQAPSPTEPTGKGGAHRLSPRFTEWLMGLPDGWITDVPGVTRNEALKACGNGVVVQQAIAALYWLLDVSEAAA